MAVYTGNLEPLQSDDEDVLLKKTAQLLYNAWGGGVAGGGFTSGAGVPSGGADGDAYLRTTNLYLYLNISGTWTIVGQLVPVS